MSVKIFFCYAREDEALLHRLKIHLEALRRQGLIEMWYDRNINAGEEWTKEIDKHLDSAKIILLLVSQYFMASEYCYDIEMKKAMERHEQGKAVVIPIILRPVSLQRAPFGKLQALPTDARPVKSKSWHNQDEAFYDVSEGIRKVAEQLREFVLLRTLTSHSDPVRSIAIHRDEQTLVSGSDDKTIKVWNLRTGELLRSFSGHSEAVCSVRIGPDGQTLVSGSWDNSIKVWGKL